MKTHIKHQVSTEVRGQPYSYERREISEPDWQRLPGFRNVSASEWRDVKWQRGHSVTNVKGLAEVFGHYLSSGLAESIMADQQNNATMSIRVTPQVLNTFNERDLWGDPIRHYVIPAELDRERLWRSHPKAQKDSLCEAEMTVREGLVHRYPTKVLVEMTTSCPQQCGHCTRLDSVGPDINRINKTRLLLNHTERLWQIIKYLKLHPEIRDVVVSGGDIANVQIDILESFVSRLLELEQIKTIRLATKAVIALPQYFFDSGVLRMFERLAKKARKAGAEIAIHTHTNHANSVTRLVAEATERLLDTGIRNIRNQGVLLRGVNASTESILDLCFALVDHTNVTPYYFYMCDMIPNAEHWRIPLHQAQLIEKSITGYLSGFSTPRIVCDVPRLGKRSVNLVKEYDRIRGISYWEKNYFTPLDDINKRKSPSNYLYFDPVSSLPSEGQAYWSRKVNTEGLSLKA